jgi:hypothetical protein
MSSIPFSARRFAIKEEFVSMSCPRRSSDPIAMISAFMDPVYSIIYYFSIEKYLPRQQKATGFARG